MIPPMFVCVLNFGTLKVIPHKNSYTFKEITHLYGILKR